MDCRFCLFAIVSAFPSGVRGIRLSRRSIDGLSRLVRSCLLMKVRNMSTDYMSGAGFWFFFEVVLRNAVESRTKSARALDLPSNSRAEVNLAQSLGRRTVANTHADWRLHPAPARIRRKPLRIRSDTVFGQIKTVHFLLPCHPQSGGGLDDLEERQTERKRPGKGGEDAQQLDQQLLRPPADQRSPFGGE